MGYLFDIKSTTIHLQKPNLPPDNSNRRLPIKNYGKYEQLISGEAFLRRLAYKNSPIKTGDSFFDDSDMKSDYFLVIVYDKKSNAPLLSARYYFEKSVIKKYISGDGNSKQAFHSILDKFNTGELFLIDRMSANKNSIAYRKHRTYIHLLFYSELLKKNRNCKIIAMARKEKNEKLLGKYLRLGLDIIGSVRHQEKEHWILFGDMKRCFELLKTSTVGNLYLMTKISLNL